MATAPVKSKALHNFSLPCLKWGNNQTSNHRRRKQSPSLDHHRSSASEPDSDGGGYGGSVAGGSGGGGGDGSSSYSKIPVGSRSSKHRLFVAGAEDPPPATNLLIKFRKEQERKPKPVDDEHQQVMNLLDDSSSAGKPWNLRPRKSIMKVAPPFEIGAGVKAEPEEKQENLMVPKSSRLRQFVEAQTVEKKEKQKFSIALEREEIEEDLFIMTGNKPHRRPKKRPRSIQKQLDNVFPGMWLAGVTPDCYNVPEIPTKGR